MDEIVSAIESKRDEQDFKVCFVDESHFSNAPYVQRGWLRAKVKRKVCQPKTRQSKTIFGALDLHSQRMYWKQVPRGNASTFIAFLHQLHQSFPDQLLALLHSLYMNRTAHRMTNGHDLRQYTLKVPVQECQLGRVSVKTFSVSPEKSTG